MRPPERYATAAPATAQCDVSIARPSAMSTTPREPAEGDLECLPADGDEEGRVADQRDGLPRPDQAEVTAAKRLQGPRAGERVDEGGHDAGGYPQRSF